MTELDIDPPTKIDGRTKAGRLQRAQKAQLVQDEAPQPRRAATREPLRDVRHEHVGHNGEVLTRKRKSGIDPFHIPGDIVPKGWTYQWNVISVVGNSEVVLDQSNEMYENGWRPVPADRHPGMFIGRGKTGDIVRGGQRLEERPVSLTNEARAEEIGKARQQMRDRDESLMGSKANLRGAMPAGFEMGGKYRGTGGMLKLSIDPAIDAPTPNYNLATGEE